nr:putative outer membrane usher protein YfcU [Serratia symbiotica]
MNVYRYFAVRPLSALLALVTLVNNPAWSVQTIEFNTDFLDVKDGRKIDLSDFSRADYLMPGQYQMVVRINKNELREQNITFMPPEDDPKGSVPCLTSDLVKQLGFTAAASRELRWWKNGQCLKLDSLKGMSARGDLGSSSLYLNVPQAYLEYVADNWDPPSRWDNGISALLFDYNLNAHTSHITKGHDSQTLSGNGTTGFNLGAWRLRADWQGNYDRSTKKGNSSNNWDISRYDAYRTIAALRAKLRLGESYLNSTVFDSFRFLGASLVSDDNMLPPNLRGYAPEVSGVAKTNAKVTISQQGRVLYETTVPSGLFRIQDLNSVTSGTLDIKIQEQDGTSRTFQIRTANVPYLTRPGQLRYKLALGKPSHLKHNTQGTGFATSEFSWGLNNSWSLYGGAMLAADYNTAAVGVGRDLLSLGALSFDVTCSRGTLPQQGMLSGRAFHLSYSKRFDEYDSQVTIADYRFPDRNYLSMGQYLDTRYHGNNHGSSKEIFTVTFNKQFPDMGISSYINYSHRTYWDLPANDSYNLSLSRYFNVGRVSNVSINLSAYRNLYNNHIDDSLLLSLSVPWGNTGSLTYDGHYNRSGSSNSNGSSNMVGYSDRIDDNNSYNVKSGVAQQGRGTASGYFTHDGDMAQLIANASYESGQYSSVGLGLQGGITATLQGAVMHRINALGGTRIMVDTDGVNDVPIRGYGGISHSNRFGKAVSSDVNSYYRNSLSVDINALPDNVDATRSVVQATLTEGAVGYRRFGVISGEKAMATIRLTDGSAPPLVPPW